MGFLPSVRAFKLTKSGLKHIFSGKIGKLCHDIEFLSPDNLFVLKSKSIGLYDYLRRQVIEEKQFEFYTMKYLPHSHKLILIDRNSFYIFQVNG